MQPLSHNGSERDERAVVDAGTSNHENTDDKSKPSVNIKLSVPVI